MAVLFYIAALVAVLSTVLMLTRLNSVHALLYLTVSLLAVAVVFYTLGAIFMAVLEVVVYAGAIMVLFVFVVMVLNLGNRAVEIERAWVRPGMFTGPVILAAILGFEVAYLLMRTGSFTAPAAPVGPRQVALALYGPYLLGVELASFLLLGALVGAYHVGSRRAPGRMDGSGSDRIRVTAGGDLVRAGADRPSRPA
ncbi:MAG TPA: NADH-quinone oxidoreductase subunit J [Candidatus Acidoferrales bacterium]|nr:NADH-quinone oxidoreductase subunit J [Candidatus Acidoferrales bacterium]